MHAIYTLQNLSYINDNISIYFKIHHFTSMFGKKLPLKQPPPQVYQQQYSQAESEPLIQQVDSNYEPTEKQVKEYAIQTLGMRFPQDQNLLYLAREGLKAPIPPNWVPYQSRHGDIYYKHKITQQKIYDHPTDIQYRKKYEQLKEKAARKNLKSISLKQNMGMQGLLPNNNSLATGLGLLNNSALPQPGISNISNMSGLSMGEDFNTQPTIDQQVIAEYEKQLAQYEKKQQKQWKEWQQQMEDEHRNKMRRIKQQNDEERARLQGKGGNSKKSQDKLLQEQQAKLAKTLQESQQNSLNQQMRLIEKQQENKLEEYKAVYEEDNEIKLRKFEHELQSNYEEKSKALEEKLRKLEEKRLQQRQNRMKILKQTKQQLEKPDNPEIIALLKSTLDDNLKGIKQEYSRRIKQKQQQMQHQLHEMKKVLGIDKGQNLLVLASKKQKLLTLSTMKITSKRNKQIQIIENEAAKELQNQLNRLKQKLNQDMAAKIQKRKKWLEDKYKIKKAQIDNQYIDKATKNIEQMYQNVTIEKNSYESTMNKKMSDLRMVYINKLSNGQGQGQDDRKNKDHKEELIINRVLLQEKENQINNKEQLNKSLERQLQLERKQWKVLQFEEELSKVLNRSRNDENELTSFLKSKVKLMNISYKSPQLTQYIETLISFQQKYRQDKKLLTKILKALQDTAAYNFYEMKKNSGLNSEATGAGTGAMVRKYNEDVRKMRQNEDMLNKLESLIKKAEIGGNGYENNMEQLRNFVTNQLEYKEITFKQDLQKGSYRTTTRGGMSQQPPDQSNLNQLDKDPNLNASKDQPSKYKSQYSWNTSSNFHNGLTTVQQALRQHSRFLNNVKNELNRKLYQVRYESRY